MLGALVVACAAARPGSAPTSPTGPPPVATASAGAESAPPKAVLEILIRPALAPPRVEVEIEARGGRAELASWMLPYGTPNGLELRDLDGAITARQDKVVGGLIVRLGRAARGSVRAQYSVTASAVSLDANRFCGHGAALLLLPTAYRERPVTTHIRLDPRLLGAHARAASSFGIGAEARVDASAEALARASFVAGALGYATFDGPEGIDQAAWLGTLAFDPRQVAAEVAGFRSGAREYFSSRRLTPLTLLLVADKRSAGEFSATRRTQSVLVEVGAGQQWTGAVRLAAAQQVLREWIGAELAVQPADRDHPFEAAWLADGVNRTVARELLFRFGLLTPEEYAAEIHQLIALHVTSPVLRVPLHVLAKHPDRRSAETAVVVRGALFATLLDARIREKSKGAYSLDDLLRELFTAARQRGGPLPPDAITTAITNNLDQKSALELEARYLRGGETIVLPADALGRCFVSKPTTYPVFSLGFSPQGDETGVTVASDVAPAGPAARAGLKSGEPIRALAYLPARTDVPVTLEVQRGTDWKKLSYLPVGGSARGQGFARVPGVRDEHCARR
jgi:hypothetical protein